MVTDGEQSFSVFTYNCNMLQWSGLFEHAVIGANVGSGIEDNFPAFQNHRLSSLPQVTMVACANQDRGIQWADLIYKIGDVSDDEAQRNRSECMAIYRRDIELFGNRFPPVQPCPCSISQAQRDRRFFFNRISIDSAQCFAQRFPLFRTGAAQECCYSAQFDS